MGRWGAVVVAVVAVAGVAHLVGSSVPVLEDWPGGTGGPDVELPDPTELDGDAERSGPQGCVPEGCELWRIEIDHDGRVMPGDGILIDTERLRGGLDGVGTGDIEDGVGTGDIEDGVGTGEIEDGVGHALPMRIRTYSSVDGEVLWERTLRAMTGSMYGWDGAFTVEGLVLVATPSGLVALGADDGEERWVSEVAGGAPVSWTSIDDDLVIATETIPGAPAVDTGHGELPLGDGPQVHLARIDRTSGEVRWRVEGIRLLGFGRAEVFVAGEEPGAVILLDLADGTPRWERTWPDLDVGYQWPTTANGRVALTGERGVVVASLATGDTIARFDRDPARAGPVELVGDLLVFGPPWAGTPSDGLGVAASVTLVTLQDPEPRTEVFDDVVAALPLYGRSLGVSGAWPEASGVALFLRTEDGYTLRVLAPDGQQRWERRWGAGDDDCCWNVRAGIDGRSVVVVPRGATSEPVQVLSLRDGETVDTAETPVGLQEGYHLDWLGPVLVAQAEGPRSGVVVVGPGGRFFGQVEARGVGYGIHSWDEAILVLWLGRTLVGLDLEVLTGAP